MRASGFIVRRTWEGVMRFAVMFGVIVAVLLIGADVLRYPLTSDLPAFLWGAQRVADGATPYGPIPGSLHAYVYAPWLAVALIPATWLPPTVVAPIWHALLAVGAVVAVAPLLRARRLEASLAAALLGTFLFHAVWAGHFEPLMVALLVVGLPTRWGPVAIGIAASLKITPIVLCVRYAGRGEWRQVALAVVVAAVLWAPALLFDLRGWGLPVMKTHSLLGHAPILWALVAIVAAVLAWRAARTRYGWLAAAALWLAVLPRMILYDVGGLAVASAGLREVYAPPISERARRPPGGDG